MHRATTLRKTVGQLLLVLPLALGCVTARPFSRVTPALPERLVLALDGVDYRDIVAAREKGLFAGFREPSRLVSTFPSISDVSWHDIMGVQPPPGYQRIYYSVQLNRVVGGMLDAIRPIEYERRMDFAFGTTLHHLAAYLMSNKVASREVDSDVKAFLGSSGRRTIYAYNVGPDALQHTRGNLDKYLTQLDGGLSKLQREYRARTGRDVQIVILSDHGHNRASTAEFLPVTEALEREGFRTVSELLTPADVAFSVDGVTTGFGVFAHPDSVQRVASLLVALDGVAIVTTRDSAGRYLVRADSALAEITTRGSGDSTRYRYRPLRGDPLRYADVLARIAHDRTIPADGYATAASWLRYTATELFPAAPPRIVRGHTVITRNPAPILVSLEDRVRVGLGAVSVVNRMRPLGGTHGALSATNSLGVVMANFVDTRDDLTQSVRHQFGGFNDLFDPAVGESSLRLATPAMLRADRWSGFRSDTVPFALQSLPNDTPLLVLSLSDDDRRWAGAAARVMVDVQPTGVTARGDTAVSDSAVSDSAQALSQWVASTDGRTFAIRARDVGVTLFPPSSTVTVRVRLIGGAGAGLEARGRESREVATLTLRTDARGAVVLF